MREIFAQLFFYKKTNARNTRWLSVGCKKRASCHTPGRLLVPKRSIVRQQAFIPGIQNNYSIYKAAQSGCTASEKSVPSG